MGKGAVGVMVLLVLLATGWWGVQQLPPQYNPFAPLTLDEPPTALTRYKLRQLANQPQECAALLAQAQARGMISWHAQADSTGACPLKNVVRVARFGTVRLSSSFLASCPLAVRSAMFIHRAAPQAEQRQGSALTQIDHVGSYACRNIYHRPQGRLSEHATADALDISGFRFANGQRVTVEKGWRASGKTSGVLKALFQQSCAYYGNALGPEYNAAHAGHFHLGVRGFGLCR